MKHLKCFEKYNIHNFIKKDNDNYEYFFNTNKYQYKVGISRYNNSKYFSIGFKAKTEDEHFYDMSIIVNENPYKIMQTIIKIANDFYNYLLTEYNNIISKYKFNLDFNEMFKGFVFSFTGDIEKNKKRLLLYQRYIPNDWKLTLKNNIYYLDKII